MKYTKKFTESFSSIGNRPMTAFDDRFLRTQVAQGPMLDGFKLFDEEMAIKHLDDIEENFFCSRRVVEQWIANGKNRSKVLDSDQSNADITEEFVQADSGAGNSHLIKRVAEMLVNISLRFKMVKKLRKLEIGLTRYEKIRREWTDDEVNRHLELECYLSENEISLESEQVDLLLEASDSIKSMAEKSVPIFLQIVVLFEKLNLEVAAYQGNVSNRVADLAARAEQCSHKQIEDMLDFSDHYRALARAYDPNNKIVKEFDDIDSLREYLETI